MSSKKANDIANEEVIELLDSQIKEHLKNNLSKKFYDAWIEDFVLEKIDSNQIVMGYYGDKPLKKFEDEYKDIVWSHMSAVVGNKKKFKINKRKNKEEKTTISNPKIKKHIKTAKLLLISMIFAVVAIVFAVLTCNYIIYRNFTETFYSVSSLKIDNHIRVIHISDLHSCQYGENNSKIVNRVSKLDPDIIVLTGDITDKKRYNEESTLAFCSALSNIAPSYYIYGNNEVEEIFEFDLSGDGIDSFFGFNDYNRNEKALLDYNDSFEKIIEKTGMKVLKNETDRITVGTTVVDIYGMLTSNPSAFHRYTYKSFNEFLTNDSDNFKITAVHEPFIFEEFEVESWGDLMMCGHTHGGGMRVPVLGPLYTHEGGLFPERNGDYVYGRYDVAGRPLIVSCGMENKNILRINNQPELIIIDVNKF